MLPITPPDAVTEIIRENVIINDHAFVIDRPAKSDELIDHPAIRSAFAADEYLPYWTDLWPAARMLAKAVLRESWPARLTCLEIGCGLGLPGIAALARGLKVIFNDYDPTAIAFAATNARLNGFSDFTECPFDWRDPPADFQVPLALGADLIYELRNVEPLMNVLRAVLQPGGQAWLTDQDRKPTAALLNEFEKAGWPYTAHPMRAGAPGQPRVKGTLYKVRRPAG